MNNRNFVNLDVNPCKMCMPMGGSIAFKGIEKTMIMMHGSQGCSTYIRRHMATHFHEPIDIASSSLNEKQTVFGGADNLKQGLKNVMKVYNPKLIGIVTTCLAETIGEDIDKILREFIEEEQIDTNKVKFVPVSTPGYGGSQFEGYYKAIRKTIEVLGKPTDKTNKINIIAGHLSPGDIRHLKYILGLFGIEYTMLPDISETLDNPYSNNFKKLASGGTKLEDIEKMPGAIATIEMGAIVSNLNSPGAYLKQVYNIPLYRMALPIGLENTDDFVNTLAKISGKEIPEELVKARGRMIDGMIDSHKYNAEGVAAVMGDPEMIYAISKLCFENGIIPAVIATGSSTNKINSLLEEEIKKYPGEITVLEDSDYNTSLQHILENKVNILIGNSDAAQLEEKNGIPLVRIGFPNHNFMGAQRMVSVGYDGSMWLLDRITNTILHQKLSNYRNKMYDEYYTG